MKDETVESMFDEIIETTIKSDGEVEVKLIEGSAEEMTNAIEELKAAWRNFKKIDALPNAALHSVHQIEWWRAVDWLGIADGRCREAFLGRQRDPESVKLYAKLRRLWVEGIGGPYYRPNA